MLTTLQPVQEASHRRVRHSEAGVERIMPALGKIHSPRPVMVVVVPHARWKVAKHPRVFKVRCKGEQLGGWWRDRCSAAENAGVARRTG